MVSAGLVGLIMTALMYLLGQSGKFGSTMSREFETVEGVSDAIGQISNVLMQTTRIKSCLCQANTNSRAACVWNPLGNPWYDPVVNGSAANGAVIFSGEFEAFDGAQSGTSMSALLTSNISSIAGNTCATTASNLGAALLRGCKIPYSINYWAPVAHSGATQSVAGELKLTMGSNSVQIGAATVGGVPAYNGANGFGVVQMACGFEENSGGVSPTNFVLNLRVKARSSTVGNTSNINYESWYPGDTNYYNGMIRDVQIKAEMRNLAHRGVYFWRPSAVRNCQGPGVTVSTWQQCCSQAWTGTACALCGAAGSAASNANRCCSGQMSAGLCL